jgi:hypothetical protein
MFKNSEQKTGVYISTLYVLRKSFGRKSIFCVLCEKDKIWFLKRAFHETVLYFFHKTQKLLVFRETWRAHISY